jgi:hypothetical protein
MIRPLGDMRTIIMRHCSYITISDHVVYKIRAIDFGSAVLRKGTKYRLPVLKKTKLVKLVKEKSSNQPIEQYKDESAQC